jgi:hypothetical protein
VVAQQQIMCVCVGGGVNHHHHQQVAPPRRSTPPHPSKCTMRQSCLHSKSWPFTSATAAVPADDMH